MQFPGYAAMLCLLVAINALAAVTGSRDVIYDNL
jgi:hypothetical protein